MKDTTPIALNFTWALNKYFLIYSVFNLTCVWCNASRTPALICSPPYLNKYKDNGWKQIIYIQNESLKNAEQIVQMQLIWLTWRWFLLLLTWRMQCPISALQLLPKKPSFPLEKTTASQMKFTCISPFSHLQWVCFHLWWQMHIIKIQRELNE